MGKVRVGWPERSRFAARRGQANVPYQVHRAPIKQSPNPDTNLDEADPKPRVLEVFRTTIMESLDQIRRTTSTGIPLDRRSP